MKQEYIEKAEGYEVLGPEYFRARDIAERFMVGFEAEHFKPLIEKAAKEFQEKLWDGLPMFLIGDTESNLQGQIQRDVESIVEAILGGAQWALQRYVLSDRINCEEIRKSVAQHIPTEVMSGRIADLEKEVRNLQSTLDGYRNRY